MIEAGSVVKKIGETLLMTVESVGFNNAVCCWFDADDQFRRASFSIDELELKS